MSELGCSNQCRSLGTRAQESRGFIHPLSHGTHDHDGSEESGLLLDPRVSPSLAALKAGTAQTLGEEVF